MSKHSFVYSIVEEFVKIDEETLNKINKIKLKKDNNIPDMNLTSYYNRNTFFDNFIKDKLNKLLPNRFEYTVPKSGHLPHIENQIDFERYLFDIVLK